jgi:2-polyprenyl-3-methyl-5-hydroxy-6-metoxy-1,4-benzoquinol methylase
MRILSSDVAPHPDPEQGSGSGAPCPICGSDQTQFFANGRDRLFQLVPGCYRLRRCVSCRCIYQDPIPSADELGRLYPARYWWARSTPEESGSAPVLARLQRIYREAVVTLDHVRFLRKCAFDAQTEGCQLLDIGCGSGTFLHMASRKGFVPHGMDAAKNAVDLARAQYGICAREGEIGQDVWPDKQFDFITMFHVLEHLPDPRSGLSYAIDLLKPGGSLVLQVPNADSLQARFFRDRWHGLDVPRHVINFTPKSLNRLLEEAGLRAHSTCRFSMRDNPAALVSSLAPALDPIGRRGVHSRALPQLDGALALVYLGLFLLAVPVTWLESAIGYGATLWVHAIKPKH